MREMFYQELTDLWVSTSVTQQGVNWVSILLTLLHFGCHLIRTLSTSLIRWGNCSMRNWQITGCQQGVNVDMLTHWVSTNTHTVHIINDMWELLNQELTNFWVSTRCQMGVNTVDTLTFWVSTNTHTIHIINEMRELLYKELTDLWMFV